MRDVAFGLSSVSADRSGRSLSVRLLINYVALMKGSASLAGVH
jgi:hypothetical protein